MLAKLLIRSLNLVVYINQPTCESFSSLRRNEKIVKLCIQIVRIHSNVEFMKEDSFLNWKLFKFFKKVSTSDKKYL